MNCIEYPFDEVVTLFDKQRVPLSSMDRAKRQGKYRYYGAQGIIDYIDDYIFDGEYILLAEDGENLKSNKQNLAQLVDGKFWVNNHAHILRTKRICRLRYFYYWINSKNMTEYVTGSAQPKLSQSSLKKMVIPLPSLEVQDKILGVIIPIDEKIKENARINKNLLQQASSIYQAWFEDFVLSGGSCPSDWSQGTLLDIADITNGKRPPFKSSEKTGTAVIPLVGATSVMGYTTEANHTDKILVIGRVGTHGVVQRFNSPCWTSDNTLVITSDLYEYTFQILQRIDYYAMNRGSTQPLITQGDMNKVSILIPDKETLSNFENLVGQLMKQYEANLLENAKLAELRDTLLPRLMSDDLDVSSLDL